MNQTEHGDFLESATEKLDVNSIDYNRFRTLDLQLGIIHLIIGLSSIIVAYFDAFRHFLPLMRGAIQVITDFINGLVR